MTHHICLKSWHSCKFLVGVNTLYWFLRIFLQFSNQKFIHKLLSFLPNFLNKFLLNSKNIDEYLSSILSSIVNHLCDLFERQRDTVAMNVFSASFAFSIAASKSNQALGIRTYFGYFISRWANNIGIVLFEAVKNIFDLRVCVMTFTLFHFILCLWRS